MSNIDDQISQARERLRDLQAKARKQERRDDTRRKILYGAAVLALAANLDEASRARVFARLHSHIRRDRDRAFLGLGASSETMRVDRNTRH